MPPRRRSIFARLASPSARGLALCAAGGVVCDLLATPLPWMIGPLLAMSAARLYGGDVDSPDGGRPLGQLIIGCTLGLYFTPIVAGVLLLHLGEMLIAAAFAITLGYVCAYFLSRVSGVDRTTAFFASTPGGASEMTLLAERHSARQDKVAFAQSLRILLVVVIVPAVLTYSGVHGTDQYQPSPGNVSYPGLALLLTLCGAGAWILSVFNVPNAWMLGPLFVSVGITVGELELSAMPTPLSSLGQLLIGCMLGSRFQKEFLHGARRYFLGVVATVVLALVLSALFAWALAWFAGLTVPTMILATAPGGIAEMGITAKVLQLGVPLVTAFHLTRIILLVTLTAPLFRFAQGLRDKLRRQRRK
jgi:hypothetical protein